jgi:hypothetical protein
MSGGVQKCRRLFAEKNNLAESERIFSHGFKIWWGKGISGGEIRIIMAVIPFSTIFPVGKKQLA